MKRSTLTHVRDLETDEVGIVVDLLAAQLTAEFNGKIRFYLYRDHAVTWKEEKDVL